MTIAAVAITTLITILFMLALRPLALALGIVDRPGGHKRHNGNVPIIGGAAMFLGVAVGLALLPDLDSSYSYFLLAGGLLVVIGIIDDSFALTAIVRLVAQLAAVLVLVFGAGLVMTDIGDPLWIGKIYLGPLSLLTTALIFISVINAYNLIDGLDGLAGGMVLIAVMAVAAVAVPGSAGQTVAFIMAAAVAGYLVFNLPLGGLRPFRAFMGDAGSTFLGLSIVWLTVTVSQGPERTISPVNGLWFAAIPIFDLFTCFVRRTLAGGSPLQSGHDHFHHILQEGGMSRRQTVAILIALQSIYGAFGVASVQWAMPEPLLFSIWAVLGVAQRSLIRQIAKVHARLRVNEPAI